MTQNHLTHTEMMAPYRSSSELNPSDQIQPTTFRTGFAEIEREVNRSIAQMILKTRPLATVASFPRV